MEIPLYALDPDRRFSWKDYGTQRRRAFAATNGQAARFSPAARGAITGVLLGASLWGAILVLAGLIKV